MKLTHYVFSFIKFLSLGIFDVLVSDPRILFNICFHYINLNFSIRYLGTFRIFSNIKILLRDRIISGKRVSVCSESGSVLAHTWRLRAKSIETVSRARRRVSSRCTFHTVEHSFSLMSIVSYFSVGLSRLSHAKSLPCLRRITYPSVFFRTCVTS